MFAHQAALSLRHIAHSPPACIAKSTVATDALTIAVSSAALAVLAENVASGPPLVTTLVRDYLATRLVDVRLLDHLIVGAGEVCSMAELGLL